MLTAAAAGLLITGILLVTIATIGLKKPHHTKHHTHHQPHHLACEAPSPDDSLLCNQEIGHYGWHRHNETSWYGNTWAIDQWAETQEAPIPEPEPEPTMSAAEWARIHTPTLITTTPPAKETTPTQNPYPDIIGPKPLQFKTGLFGTRHRIKPTHIPGTPNHPTKTPLQPTKLYSHTT